MENFTSFLLACVALIVSPGPAPMMIAATSAAFGWRRAGIVILGLITSMCLIILLVGTGIARLAFSYPAVVSAFSLVAIFYMFYLAYRIAMTPPIGEIQKQTDVPSYWSGVFLNFVNPKAYAAIGALFSGFVLFPDAPSEDTIAKGVIVLLVICIGNVCWMLTGATLSPLMRIPKTSKIINFSFAFALLASMALMFLS